MRTKANRDLTLRQRDWVSREISKEYDKWRRKKGEPTEEDRRQIVAIGFSKARKKHSSIPKRNPFDVGTKLLTDVIGGIGFGIGAGITERYIMKRSKNPGAETRVSIRPVTYRGKVGYSVSGTDLRGRSVRIFVNTLEGAEEIKRLIKSGASHEQIDQVIRSGRNPEVFDNARRRKADDIDSVIEQAYYRHSSGTQISIMDIPKLFRDVKLEIAGGTDMDTAVQNAIARYQANPLNEREQRQLHEDMEGYHELSMQEGIPASTGAYLRGQRDGYRDISSYYGPHGGSPRNNPLLMTVLGANPRKRRCRNPGVTRRLKNPGRTKKKITMSIRKFWAWLKRKGDPKLLSEFKKKIEGYRKWTHGTMPKSVTLELKDVPGMSGIWMTYGMGVQPESTYLMPKGSKRKGAWKHKWENHPKLMGDPESGLIVTQLVKGNKLTDFMHG